ncbi:hypothetical protein [Streptomyces sp. NPDC014894]|uniref:hypothetical protein n=1 Tax=unclassified Streptomyces TaxID=2593676 RepID=UPI0036F554B4
MKDGRRADSVEALEAELRAMLRREADSAPADRVPVQAVLRKGREARRRRSEARTGLAMAAGVMAVVAVAVFGNGGPAGDALPADRPQSGVSLTARKVEPYQAIPIGRGVRLALVPDGEHFYVVNKDEGDITEQIAKSRAKTGGMLEADSVHCSYSPDAGLVSGVFRTTDEAARIEVWAKDRKRVFAADTVRLKDDTSWGVFYAFVPKSSVSFDYGVVAYGEDGSVLAAGEGSHEGSSDPP